MLPEVDDMGLPMRVYNYQVQSGKTCQKNEIKMFSDRIDNSLGISIKNVQRM